MHHKIKMKPISNFKMMINNTLKCLEHPNNNNNKLAKGMSMPITNQEILYNLVVLKNRQYTGSKQKLIHHSYRTIQITLVVVNSWIWLMVLLLITLSNKINRKHLQHRKRFLSKKVRVVKWSSVQSLISNVNLLLKRPYRNNKVI